MEWGLLKGGRLLGERVVRLRDGGWKCGGSLAKNRTSKLGTWNNGGGVGLVVRRVVRAAKNGEGDDALRLHFGLVELDVVVDGRLRAHLLTVGRRGW